MKAAQFQVVALIALAGCSRPSSTVTTDAGAERAVASSSVIGALDVTTKGFPSGLRVNGSIVTFCDSRGGRRLDLATGVETALAGACVQDGEPNIACAGLGLDITVSTPNLGPDDVLDVSGRRYPLTGRVHDCAVDSGVVGIVTGSRVVLIDTIGKKASPIDEQQGGDRVALGRGWLAWTSDDSVHVRKR